MKTSEILKAYNKYCTCLEPADRLLPRDYNAITRMQLEKISDDDIIKAFKMANESDFLCGQKTNFKANIKWLCDNIQRVLDGRFNNIKKDTSLDNNREYDFKELERNILEETKRNGERLRSDKGFRKSLEEWVVKYPNLKPVLED